MSSFKLNTLVGALALASTAYAHGHVKTYTLNGQSITGGVNGGLSRTPKPDTAAWLADNMDNGFVIDPTSPDIICHKGGIPGAGSFTIAAGDTISMTWDQWPQSHAGPVIDYLAPVSGDFASVDKASLAFTKIAEAGLSNGKWAGSDVLIANGLTWPVTIPSSVAPGNYILRHEILALHEGNRQGGTQFYPQCMNIVVTGSGTNTLSGGTPAQSFYKASDPGVLFDMYNNPTSYPIPGPPLMASAGSSSPPASGGNTSPPASGGSTSPPASGGSTTPPASTPAPANPAPAPSTTAAPAPVPTTLQTVTRPAPTGGCGSGGDADADDEPVSSTVGKYGQCGGQGYNGPTTCAAGSTCQVQNPWYSQCL